LVNETVVTTPAILTVDLVAFSLFSACTQRHWPPCQAKRSQARAAICP